MESYEENTSPKKKSKESEEKENLTKQLESIVGVLAKITPVFNKLESNLPKLIEMREVFESECLEKSNNVDSGDVSDEEQLSEKASGSNSIQNNVSEGHISDDEANEDSSLFTLLSFGKVNETVIDDSVSKGITKVLKEGMDKNELKSILEKHEVPKNCPRLKVVPTNIDIEKLSSKARHTDKQLIRIQNIMSCALSILSQCLTKSVQDEPVPNDLLAQATALFGHSSYLLDKQRRLTYEACLNVDYSKSIASNDSPIEEKLFGNNLNEQIKNVSESLKYQHKIKSKKGFFFNRTNPYYRNKAFLGKRPFQKSYQAYKHFSQHNRQYSQYNNQNNQIKKSQFFKKRN